MCNGIAITCYEGNLPWVASVILGVCLPTYKDQVSLPWGTNELTWGMRKE